MVKDELDWGEDFGPLATAQIMARPTPMNDIDKLYTCNVLYCISNPRRTPAQERRVGEGTPL
jgi:hypothetical protein